MANQTTTFPEFQPSAIETCTLWVDRLEIHLALQKKCENAEKCVVIEYMGPAAFS